MATDTQETSAHSRAHRRRIILWAVLIATGLALAHAVFRYVAPWDFVSYYAAPASGELANPLAKTDSGIRKPPTPGVGPSQGKDSTPVTIVEFTDYQCSLCGQYFTTAFKQMKKEYIDTGKVHYEVRNFPITNLHPNAQLAAEATLCALQQDAFWPMHDRIFQSQAQWTDQTDPAPAFKNYAVALGLDKTAFAACLDNGATQPDIERDMTDAMHAGIAGAPSFWIFGPNGQLKQINGAYPYAYFKIALDTMLRQ